MNKKLRWMGPLLLTAVLALSAACSGGMEPVVETAAVVAESGAVSERPAVAPAQTVTTTETISTTIVTAVELLTVQDEPTITHGPMSGEITGESAVVWARGSQTGTLTFAVAPITAGFGTTQTITVTKSISQTTDWVGEVELSALMPGTAYAYRVDLTAGEETGPAVQGSFQTAPEAGTPFSFVFGSCIGGQGYCRDAETGWYIFETMLQTDPDFFLITGDSVYVDNGCPAPQNVPGAETVDRTLDGYRGRYAYHLADPAYATFLAQTPVYVTWDDHEVLDDFGGPSLSVLNEQMYLDGKRAFFDYWPLQEDDTIYRSFRYGAAELILLDTRSYRDPNVNWDPNPNTLEPKTMLGAEQFAWLQQTLSESTATWKFIVTSTPLSYPTGFPQPQVDGRDGWADYTEKSGYETELMSLLFYIEGQNIPNVVFLTGDTHWPFALSYDPDRDGEVDFYEFGSSPISAINLPPVDPPDQTFNPTVMFAEGEFNGTAFNFGQVLIDGGGDLTVRMVDRDGNDLYRTSISPAGQTE